MTSKTRLSILLVSTPVLAFVIVGGLIGGFLFGFFFFELMLNISGVASGLIGPLPLVALGLFLLMRRFLPTSQAAAISAPTVTGSSEPAPPVAASEAMAPVVVSESVPAADEGHAEELLAISKGEPVDIHGMV